MHDKICACNENKNTNEKTISTHHLKQTFFTRHITQKTVILQTEEKQCVHKHILNIKSDYLLGILPVSCPCLHDR